MSNIQILSFIVILLCDLVLAAARAGLLNIRPARMVSLQDELGGDVTPTITLVSERARLRAGLKLSQVSLRFLMASLILTFFVDLPDLTTPPILIASILLVTAVLIWFVEFVVERLILKSPEVWAMRFTPLARLLLAFLTPILALPMRLFGKTDADGGRLVTVTEGELKALVDVSQKAGVLESDERKMIFSIFEFGDTLAKEIMVPRIDMQALDVTTPLEKAADAVLASGYSRVPVFEEKIDNIIGILYTKDMLKVWRSGGQNDSLRGLLRDANFIPETKKVDDLLVEMQAARTHIAIVVDEYGGIAGLVTLEDIVEEIFGEIQDEFDEAEELEFEKVAEGEYVFLGRVDLHNVDALLGSDLEQEEADTLGGLVYSTLGRVPKLGETLTVRQVELTVEQVTSRRIRKVRARRGPGTPTKEFAAKEESTNAD